MWNYVTSYNIFSTPPRRWNPIFEELEIDISKYWDKNVPYPPKFTWGVIFGTFINESLSFGFVILSFFYKLSHFCHHTILSHNSSLNTNITYKRINETPYKALSYVLKYNYTRKEKYNLILFQV